MFILSQRACFRHKSILFLAIETLALRESFNVQINSPKPFRIQKCRRGKTGALSFFYLIFIFVLDQHETRKQAEGWEEGEGRWCRNLHQCYRTA